MFLLVCFYPCPTSPFSLHIDVQHFKLGFFWQIIRIKRPQTHRNFPSLPANTDIAACSDLSLDGCGESMVFVFVVYSLHTYVCNIILGEPVFLTNFSTYDTVKRTFKKQLNRTKRPTLGVIYADSGVLDQWCDSTIVGIQAKIRIS